MSSQRFKGTKPSKLHDTYSRKKQSRNKQKILLDRSADRRRRRLDEYIRMTTPTVCCQILVLLLYGMHSKLLGIDGMVIS